jgi:cell division septal protein FtsQ
MDAQGMGMVVLIPFIGFIAMMVAGYMTLNVGTILMASGLLAIADVIGLIGIAKLTDSENMLL